MFRRLATSAAALALALGSLVALSAPASAASIPCPTHSGLFSSGVYGAWADVQQRGYLVDTFSLNSHTTQTYIIDGRYESFINTGATVYRLCYNSKPKRPEGARERYRESGGGGRIGGGVSLGAGVWYVGNTVRVGSVTVGTVEDLR